MGRYDRRSAPLGIYRDLQSGWVAGVCAGIATRLTIQPVWVRSFFVLPVLLNHGAAAVALYFALAFLLGRRDAGAFTSAPSGAQMAYRDLAASITPTTHVTALKSRFAALDARLNNLEAAVMADELSLRRKFKDLGA